MRHISKGVENFCTKVEISDMHIYNSYFNLENLFPGSWCEALFNLASGFITPLLVNYILSAIYHTLDIKS